MIPSVVATLVLATAHAESGPGSVPRDPPFVFLWHAQEQSSKSPRRVVAALWPDGRWLQAADSKNPGTMYRIGRLGPEDFEKAVCEIEAIALWNYSEFTLALPGPYQGLSIRQESVLKSWPCLLEPMFSDCNFTAFTDVRKALLGSVPSKTTPVTWEGLVPASWTSATGEALKQPRCRRLVEPAQLLSQLRPGNERAVVASLWDRQGRWSAVLDGIAGAQDVWLDVAERLQPGSDAGSAEDLGMAIGEAFLQAPEKILRRFGPREACYTLGFAAHGDAGDEQIAALVRRRRALADGIKARDLVEQRKECLAAIDQLQAELEPVRP
ncbi:MAG: hypothetical protein ACRD6R_04015 [Candidatus Polarisedimenticolia bacterium]